MRPIVILYPTVACLAFVVGFFLRADRNVEPLQKIPLPIKAQKGMLGHPAFRKNDENLEFLEIKNNEDFTDAAKRLSNSGNYDLLAILFTRWGKIDPHAATVALLTLSIPESNGNLKPLDLVRCALLEGWAKINPFEAAKWVASLPIGSQFTLPQDFITSLAQADPKIASSFILDCWGRYTNANDKLADDIIASALDHPGDFGQYLNSILHKPGASTLCASYLKARVSEGAISEANHWLLNLATDKLTADDFSNLCSATFQTLGPRAALTFQLKNSETILQNLQFQGDLQKLEANAASMQSGISPFTKGLMQSLNAWAIQDSVEATRWIADQPDKLLKTVLASQLGVATVLSADETMAANILNSLPLELKEGTISGMAQILAIQEPSKKEQFLSKMPNIADRNKLILQIQAKQDFNVR